MSESTIVPSRSSLDCPNSRRASERRRNARRDLAGPAEFPETAIHRHAPVLRLQRTRGLCRRSEQPAPPECVPGGRMRPVAPDRTTAVPVSSRVRRSPEPPVGAGSTAQAAVPGCQAWSAPVSRRQESAIRRARSRSLRPLRRMG